MANDMAIGSADGSTVQQPVARKRSRNATTSASIAAIATTRRSRS